MVEGAFILHRWEMERHRREDAAVPEAQINPAWRHTKQRRAAELTRILDIPGAYPLKWEHIPTNGSISRKCRNWSICEGHFDASGSTGRSGERRGWP